MNPRWTARVAAFFLVLFAWGYFGLHERAVTEILYGPTRQPAPVFAEFDGEIRNAGSMPRYISDPDTVYVILFLILAHAVALGLVIGSYLPPRGRRETKAFQRSA